MSKLMKYRVVRDHQGDRWYTEGEERVATDGDVGHLVPRVLEEIGPADNGAKAEGASDRNKAEGASPASKAAKGTKAKARPSRTKSKG